MDHRWSAEPPNLLSPQVITLVSEALNAGIVCGIQAFFGGGRGPEPRAFVDLDAYLSSIEKSRPGDWFTLWSIPDLAKRNVLLMRNEATPVNEVDLQKVQAWLNTNPMREFLAAGYRGKGGPPEACWGDHDCFDRLHDLALKCSPNGKFAALPLTDLLESTERWIPRLHIVDAKRPNERGEVPLGGAY
jgi:hypothetical protein